jgi:Holliday junction resolvase
MVERGQPVRVTTSGTKTKGDLIADCESVVMVLLSKEHHNTELIIEVKGQSVQKKRFFLVFF